MSYKINQLINHYLFKEFDLPDEDDVVSEIKVSTLDNIYSYKTSYNDSLLHIAVVYNKHYKNNKIVDSLLEKKMYVDYKNYQNETPLHYACSYNNGNNSILVEKLIQHGANVNGLTQKIIYGGVVIGNYSPLQYAIMYKSDEKTVKSLIKHGAYVTFHTKTPHTIEEHMFSEEQYNNLIDIKWSFMRDEYERMIDNNIHMVISNINNKNKNNSMYIPVELIGIIRSYMYYTREEIIECIRNKEDNM
jgi:ankyrin repeat protein